MPQLHVSRLLLPLLMVIGLRGIAQTSADQKKQDQYAQMKSLLNSKKYYFHALSATTMKGKTIQLTTEYGFRLNNDSLMVDLPYFGRSYTSDYPGTDLGIQFNTGQFSYQADSAKKGGWDITIIPKNQTKASKMTMYVSPSGYCTLQVTSNTRQLISFYGTIDAFRER
jgi:Domain of unknown function (DUF4251)